MEKNNLNQLNSEQTYFIQSSSHTYIIIPNSQLFSLLLQDNKIIVNNYINSKILDFNPNYKLFEDGKILSLHSNKFLKGQIINKTHFVDIFHPNRHSRRIPINKLIYYTFKEKIDLNDNSIIILPKDKNFLNHHVNNLILKKRAKNIYKKSKLDAYLRDIFNKAQILPKSEIAKEYNTSDTSIIRALKRYCKKHKKKYPVLN